MQNQKRNNELDQLISEIDQRFNIEKIRRAKSLGKAFVKKTSTGINTFYIDYMNFLDELLRAVENSKCETEVEEAQRVLQIVGIKVDIENKKQQLIHRQLHLLRK